MDSSINDEFVEMKIDSLDQDQYFLSLVGVIVNNENEEIYRYKSISFTSSWNGNIESYFDKHLDYDILIEIICLLVLELMCTVYCRARSEIRMCGNIKINIDTEGKGLTKHNEK